MLLTIKPLGGLGEIGSNMILVKTAKMRLIIDAGIQFPSENFFNLNSLLPNFLHQELETFTDIIITHAHEDHIGALPVLLQYYPHLKIHASPFASKIIREKFNFRHIDKDIITFIPNKPIKLPNNDMQIIPIQINHSIPETCGILFQDNRKGTSIFYASDFKVDLKATHEEGFPLKKLEQLFKQSETRLLLADSTNILNPNKTPSEKEVIAPLTEIIKKHPARCFLTFFPSNIFRLQAILTLAKKLKRKVAFCGKSIGFFYGVACESGLLKHTEVVLESDEENIDLYKNAIVLLSGCQGDFRGALNRVANGHDPHYKIRESDLFIFSSKVIPGNEKKVSKIMNKISEKGADIITASEELIHVSGHGSKQDLHLLYKTIKPSHIVPIHGESYFLSHHAKFIKKNFPAIEAPLLYNHDELVIDTKKHTVVVNKNPNPEADEVQHLLYLDSGHFITKKEISLRRKMAQHGIISISIGQNERNELSICCDSLGIPQMTERLKVKIIELIRVEFERNPIDQLKVDVRRLMEKHIGERPVVLVQTHFHN